MVDQIIIIQKNQIANKKVIEISISESNKYLNHMQTFSRRIKNIPVTSKCVQVKPGNISFFETQWLIESKELDLSCTYRANRLKTSGAPA